MNCESILIEADELLKKLNYENIRITMPQSPVTHIASRCFLG